MRFIKLVLVCIAITSISSSSFAALIKKDKTVTFISHILMKMESPAEDMLDEIDKKDSENLNLSFNKLTTSMAELNRHTRSSAISDTQSKNIALQNTWFNLISVEIKEKNDFHALAYAVNQFTGQLIITTKFKHPYDKNVAWMDYLGRELVLLYKYPDLSSNNDLISLRKDELQKTWNSLNVLISKTHNGVLLTKRINPVIVNIMLESEADKIISLSETELSLVDNIENYFDAMAK